MSNPKIPVALADDHVLLRNGLATLINTLDDYEVIFQADNGLDLKTKISAGQIPAIVLMDINMPVMDGYDTSTWLKKNYPDIKVLALSMYEAEESIIRMLRCGARGYILKDIEPAKFRAALDSLVTKGFYYTDFVTGKLLHAVLSQDQPGERNRSLVSLSEREVEFLKLICTEMTYKEIAQKMFVSARTIDGYRDDLFEKLNAKTRVGLVMYAIRSGIVTV